LRIRDTPETGNQIVPQPNATVRVLTR
jgi:hypothetical protein